MWNACPHEPTESTATMTAREPSTGSRSGSKQIEHSVRESLTFGGIRASSASSSSSSRMSQRDSSASVGVVVHGRHTSPRLSLDSVGSMAVPVPVLLNGYTF